LGALKLLDCSSVAAAAALEGNDQAQDEDK
jgi:hypothetical protein